MRKLALVLACTFAATVAVAPGAAAQDNAGIDEYVEGVPGAGGDSHDHSGGGDGDGGGQPLAEDDAAELESQGADGAAAADLAEATAPEAQASGESGGRSGQGGGSDPATGGAAQSGGAAVEDPDGAPVEREPAASTDAKAGIGVGLPILLVVTAIGAAGAVWWRRRQRASSAA